MSRVTIATDSMTYANGNLSTLSANWVDLNSSNGIHQISSNKVFGGGATGEAGGAASRYVGTGTFTDNQFASMTLNGALGTTNEYFGALARASSGTNGTRSYYYFLMRDNFPSGQWMWLAKVVNGTYTLFDGAHGALTWVAGDRISIECEGTTIRGCRNETPVGGTFTVTDSSLTTGLPGIWSSSGSTGLTGTNWIGGNLVASTTKPSLSMLMGVG